MALVFGLVLSRLSSLGDGALVTLAFRGLSKDHTSATLEITNRTKSDILCSSRLQLKESASWVDYSYSSITEIISAPVSIVLPPRHDFRFDCPLPSTGRVWRVAVRCERLPSKRHSTSYLSIKRYLDRLGITSRDVVEVFSLPIDPTNRNEK